MKRFLLLPMLLLAACQPPCNNKNVIFDKHAPGSSEYNAELAKQIKELPAASTSFWIESYEAKDDREYMNVLMYEKDMCAHLKLDITDVEAVQDYREVKGGGYSGAELKMPEIKIENSNGSYLFYLLDAAGISD